MLTVTINTIIQALEQLLRIHESLLLTSKEKTEIIKRGEPDQLQSVILKEYKIIQQLEQAEAKREKAVDDWFAEQGEVASKTISEMLGRMTDEQEKEVLLSHMVRLTEKITELKSQEHLNKELLQQSLKFVQLSLSTMNPSLGNFNYGNENKQATNRSVFDSKA